MHIGNLILQVKGATSSAAAAMERYRRFETVIVAVCITIPLVLILGDNGQIRESISAYYNMDNAQLFYFPLTVAAMLFVINGILRKKRYYNWVLGALLSGIILFNHVDAGLLHMGCAIAFFGGNALVILFHSSNKMLLFRVIMVFIIVFAMSGWLLFKLFSLFWAEWISFAIISFHYIQEVHCENTGKEVSIQA